MRTTKIRVAGTTFIVDIEEWAENYDCEPTAKAVQQDVREQVKECLCNGAVPLTIA